MAAEQQTRPAASAAAPNAQLHEIALDLFKVRWGSNGLHLPTAEELRNCYGCAGEIIAFRAKVDAGELQKTADKNAPKGPRPFQDCFAPNMRKTAAYNLVSQEYGDRDKVNRIVRWFKENPPVDNGDDQRDLLVRFNSEFSGFDWDQPMLNAARSLLPPYAASN